MKSLRLMQGSGRSLVKLPFMLLILIFVAWSVPSLGQTVTTDKDDYYPGETVIITGTGWDAGETVELRLEHLFTDHEDDLFFTTANDNGDIYFDGYVVDIQELGEVFTLTATGLSSGKTATHVFTDSPKVGSVVIGAQTPHGTIPDAVTYSITVNRGVGGGAFTADLYLLSPTFPGSVTYDFTPSTVSLPNATNSAVSVLTLYDAASLPGGPFSFTVKAVVSDQGMNGTDYAESTGGLTTCTGPVAITKNIQVYLGQNGTVTIDEDAVDDGSYDDCGGTLTFDTDITTFDCDDLGDNDVELTVTGAFANTDSEMAVVTVLLRPVTLVYTGDLSGQFSDQVTLSAELTDDLSTGPLSGVTVYFTLGTQSTSAVTDVFGVASTTLILNQMPGSYDLEIEVLEDCPYEGASLTEDFTILAEDACAVYAGVYFASTGSVNSSSATVVLAATVIEDNDGFPGDITLAKVQFYADGNLIATVPVELPVDEIGDGPSIGSATYEWTGVSVGTYLITVKVVGYYTNEFSGAECQGEALVTVGVPSPDFITGGGYVILENSKGLKAGTTGTKNNFGFNVKYNKKMTNLQGHINTIVRRVEIDGLHVYQVKGNVMNSLYVDGNMAVFTGKASIQDITDPYNPVPVDGNCTLQFTMTDNGEPGNNDLISITVWKNDGGLWFTTYWDNATSKPAEQQIDGGNLVVHTEKGAGGSANGKKKSGELSADEEIISLSDLTVFPNPATGPVSIRFMVGEDGMTTIDLYNSTGQLVQRAFEGFSAAGDYRTVQLESTLDRGLYFIHLRAGEEVKVARLVVQ